MFLSLPANWPKRVKSALLCAVALARTALIEARATLVDGKNASIDGDRLTNEVALLREELRIKDARLACIAPAHRPHYPPTERLSILALKAARGWNAAQAAQAFFVSEITIGNWLKSLDEPGSGLVALREPVNRFPDFVRQVVQQLKFVCPTKRPHHVWHIDLTIVPTHVGLWVPWIPFTSLMGWPFGYCVAVVVDHFSRKAVAVEVFKNWPSSDDITSCLDVITTSIGQRPKYIISDQGVQFREAYRDWCAARGIKPRFGAVGEHGSIAVVERFILSLKNECTRRILVPLRIDEFREELFTYCRWYKASRPHQSRGGRTPSEVSGEVAAAVVPRLEPRLRLLESNQRRGKLDSNVVPVDNLRLSVTHFEGRAHLPVVRLDWAA